MNDYMIFGGIYLTGSNDSVLSVQTWGNDDYERIFRLSDVLSIEIVKADNEASKIDYHLRDAFLEAVKGCLGIKLFMRNGETFTAYYPKEYNPNLKSNFRAIKNRWGKED